MIVINQHLKVDGCQHFDGAIDDTTKQKKKKKKKNQKKKKKKKKSLRKSV
jgi:hypothetical protein